MDSNNVDSQNPGKVKIKAISAYEVLDATGNRVCQELKHRWAQYKQSSVTAKVLTNYFESSSNPYVAALEMMVNAQDFCLSKQNSLAMFVMQTFAKWKCAKEESLSPKLTEKIKLDAFNLLLGHRNAVLLNLVIKEYKLIENKMMFLPALKEYLKETKNYKETCDWALGLHLYDNFKIDDFVLPLLLQGKFQVAQSYLDKNKVLRVPMVAFLDSLLTNRYPEAELANVANRLKVSEVKLDQLGYKSISKLITKLLKVFSLPASLTPNLMKSKGRGALSFLLHKKFVEKSISEDGWSEMVIEAVQSDASLQVELVMGVTAYGDLRNAFEWAVKYNVPRHRWPFRLQQYVDRDEMQSTSNWPRDRVEWDREEPVMNDYHKLRIPESKIITIDTVTKLESFLNELAAKNIKLVGLDAEWKPTFGFKRCDLALIQIATREKVFILDVIQLVSEYPTTYPDDSVSRVWERFATSFFGNPRIVKLGFGMATDLTALKDIFRKFELAKVTEMGFLDLATIVTILIESFKFVFPYSVVKGTETTNKPKQTAEESQTSIGLSNVVKMTLGKHLNKSDQFSNWERRPLRRDQIMYAALDAYCLLEVYDVLVKECERQKISFEEVINRMKNLKSKQKKPKKKKEGTPVDERALKRVPQFRVLCDKPLMDLGKMLRKCGVDTMIADLNQDIRPSEVEGKVPLCVITQKEDTHQFEKLGHVYLVKKLEVKDQIFEVLNHFNVKVSEEDLNTRCKECNAIEFEAFSREEIQKLMRNPRNSRPENSSKFYEDVKDLHEFTDNFVGQSHIPNQQATGRRKTKNGVNVRYSEIPLSAFKINPIFFVCTVCGECYWRGNAKRKSPSDKVLKEIVSNLSPDQRTQSSQTS